MNKADFDALDLAKIKSMLGVQEENLHLDFKQAAGTFTSADDRKNLAKVIGGFANSDGGVCIWGVDARKDGDGPDVAQKIVALPNVTAAVARLNELTAQSANPVVDGVVHKAIPENGASGVVATYVPASDSGPHMAKLTEDRYYKRSGESFIKMEHFDIEDMFGRRAKPQLSLIYRVEGKGDMVFAVLSIVNDGRAAAISPYLSLLVAKPNGVHIHGLDGNGNHGLSMRTEYRLSEWITFGGVEGNLVYPGVTFDVTAIKLKENPEAMNRPPIKVQYRLAAANFRLVEGELEIPQRNTVV
ncbi:AlbA family DNA-binding domain-containing protein [Lacipirellula sp.]|uniref:AlbA family DNA-binding domain-containing protein n=1 Tax=Lacipirellula sp. TaxID=2691419 RepID=UPI003D0B3AA3